MKFPAGFLALLAALLLIVPQDGSAQAASSAVPPTPPPGTSPASNGGGPFPDAHALSAQPPVAPGVPRTADGRVRRPIRDLAGADDSSGTGPVPNQWVVLHRVGSDSAGPVDSVRSDRNGNYHIRYTPWGVEDALYFASSTWDGIAYFTAPLRAAHDSGDATEITVFDTTSKSFPLSVKGRHLIVSRPDSADFRTVVEVFELSNDSLLALVSVDTVAPRPTWSVAIPATALDVRVSEGEISPNAFLAADGRASVYSPMAPGLKQVVFTYRVPDSSFPLTIRSEEGAVVFEILLEEPRGKVNAKGFTAVDPVNLEGRNFARFLAQDVEADSRIIIELPSTATPGRNLYIAGLLMLIGMLMLLVLSRSMQRRVNNAQAMQAATRDAYDPDYAERPLSDRIAQEIVALDAVYARHENPSEAVTQAYTQRRAELRAALREMIGGNEGT